MRKRRILMTNEFSGLTTGYSVYGKELLGRLHASGDYEVAELACCVGLNDPRLGSVPWRVYPDAPIDDEERKVFESSSVHRFGECSFNRVCLDFRPDVVLDIRDPWMYAFIERSPFRRLFHWIQMPTVDSAPQAEQWLATLTDCDRVLAYEDWNREVLVEEGGGLIDVFGVASPGADLAAFRPHDRSEMRRRFNLEDGSFIVGTVMRNQSRKLYPQLIADFSEYVATSDPGIASRSYLYLHVSYPDVGWDIPRLIKQSDVSHRILLTYKCRDCLAVFPSLYADASTVCPMCRGRRCTTPKVADGVDRETLGMIMATFDVYVQYASCEGFGMPAVEAAACGVPIMSTDYSAMSSVVRRLGGRPIKVGWMEMDADVGSYRARPDPGDFIEALRGHALMGADEAVELRRRTRKAVEGSYTWDKAVDVWRAAIESLPLRPWSRTWESPSLFHRPAPLDPSIESNAECVRWAIEHVLGRPDLVDSYMALRMTRDLNWGARTGGGRSYLNEESAYGAAWRATPYDREVMASELAAMCESANHWERARGRVAFEEKPCDTG